MKSTGSAAEQGVKGDSAEEEIRRRTEEYRVLHEVAKILHNAEGLRDMLEKVMVTLTRFRELEVENKAGIFHPSFWKRSGKSLMGTACAAGRCSRAK